MKHSEEYLKQFVELTEDLRKAGFDFLVEHGNAKGTVRLTLATFNMIVTRLTEPYPQQGIVIVGEPPVIRFRQNGIVRWMLDAGRRGTRFDLNSLCGLPDISPEEWAQLWQLIGHSVSGFGDVMAGFDSCRHLVNRANSQAAVILARTLRK